MNLIFNIDYRTNWGETLYITGNIAELGNGDRDKALPLVASNAHQWSLSTKISPAQAGFSYRYFLRREDGSTREEWGPDRYCRLDAHLPEITIMDHWQERPTDKPYYSSAFTDCICRPDGQDEIPATLPGMLQITVDAPLIPPYATLAIAGSCEALGAWNPAKALIMNHSSFPKWTIQVPLAGIGRYIEYKFLILRKSDHKIVSWEACDNRSLHIPEVTGNGSIAVSGLHIANPLALWRGAGVAIPVFSLRSEQDFGVGDFFDIKLMVDWAAATGQQMIQLLPINDTTMTGTWTDSYPYNANSTFALHPMYLRVQEMGTLTDKKRQAHFTALAHELNSLPDVDYERVNRAKNEYTRELFNQQGSAEMTSPEFKKFVERNKSWLIPYAAFCVLRDRYATADMNAWEEYAVYDESKVNQFIEFNRHDIDYVLYIQYHLHKQMSHVRDYAHSKGVAIKGDIPIGISRNSVDAWITPELFNLDCSAGAPPDDFSVLGQNWGFPTYNWEVMARDGFAWWKSRFRKMSEYFDAYRIDHVLGFFRIWQIPTDAVHGLLGVFNPALPYDTDELKYSYDFWFDKERHTTPYITDTLLGEFFGELTDEVRAQYLEPTDNGQYRLKYEFATQRRIADHFASKPTDDKNTKILNGLLGLVDNVLFIEDPYQKGKYHPRIAAQHTHIYRSLTDYERWCFDRLYNDFFYHRHNEFWRGKAIWKLPPLIDATDMLVCAEDLGMIPACVPSVMHELQILSLEIQRMPKDPATEFADTWSYPYMSVCTTSTHDMGGIRQWWEENRDRTQRYFNQVLGESGEAPFYAEPWICRKIIDTHLKSPSMLCILPLQDWLSTDGSIRRNDPREEQINVPANPRHYWRYRMHITLEYLLEAEHFNHSITDLITDSGR